jgi:hypothetical protein
VLGHAGEASPATRKYVTGALTRTPGRTAPSSVFAECATSVSFLLHPFGCRHDSQRFTIFYNIADGTQAGLPEVDQDGNDVIDAVETMSRAFEEAYDDYAGLGYEIGLHDKLKVYVGFDDNENSGLTFPVADLRRGRGDRQRDDPARRHRRWRARRG